MRLGLPVLRALFLPMFLAACGLEGDNAAVDVPISEQLADLSSAGSQSSGQDSFATSTKPVDMREYWPSDYRVAHYRRADGTLSVKRITKAHDPLEPWLSPQVSSDHHFSIEEHFPLFYGSEETRFYRGDSMVHRNDKSVWKVGEVYGAEECSAWCFKNGYVTQTSEAPKGLPADLFGRPGGHRVGEQAYRSYGVFNAATSDLNQRPTIPWYKSYSEVRLIQKFDTFQPAVGRAQDGSWGEGLGKTYSNVILMARQTGLGPGASRCETHPDGFAPVSGYHSQWQYDWLAPGIGVVQSVVLWDDAACGGYLQPGRANPISYGFVLDAAP